MKTITAFNLDLSDLPATSERRGFIIYGDKGAEFKLEIKDNTTGYYYNFTTNVFQASPSSLEEQMSSNSYNGHITFPAITGISVCGSNINTTRLFAKQHSGWNTRHGHYIY